MLYAPCDECVSLSSLNITLDTGVCVFSVNDKKNYDHSQHFTKYKKVYGKNAIIIVA